MSFEETSLLNHNDGINPTTWPFVIIGAYIVLLSVGLFLLALMKIEDRLKTLKSETVEKRPEEPFQKVFFFLFMVVLFYTFVIASSNSYIIYLYSVTICSTLQFTESQASLISTVFWLGSGIGRGCCVLYSKFLDPRKIIICDFIGTTFCLVIICAFGINSSIVMWVMSFFYGFFVDTLFSTGVSWTSRETNITGSYMMVFAVGVAIGGMGFVPAGGVVFDKEPFHVMYFVLGMNMINILAYCGLELIAKRRRNESNHAKTSNQHNDNSFSNQRYDATSSITKL